MTGDGTLNGDLFCEGDVTIWEDAHLTVKGDVYQQDDFTVNGGSLTVKGNYIASRNRLDIQEARVDISGNMRIRRNAALALSSEGACLAVAGDFQTASTLFDKNSFRYGTFEVGGDFKRTKNAHHESVNLTGTKLVLNGTGKQKVTLHTGIDSVYISSFDLTQAEEVEFERRESNPPSKA